MDSCSSAASRSNPIFKVNHRFYSMKRKSLKLLSKKKAQISKSGLSTKKCKQSLTNSTQMTQVQNYTQIVHILMRNQIYKSQNAKSFLRGRSLSRTCLMQMIKTIFRCPTMALLTTNQSNNHKVSLTC